MAVPAATVKVYTCYSYLGAKSYTPCLQDVLLVTTVTTAELV